MKQSRPDPRAQARRAALNALKRAKRAATRAGVALSDWEGEFLGSVEERIKTFGRAFGDPEKGAPGQALSMLQAVKLKEISAKAKGEKRTMGRKRPFGPKGRTAGED
ncbi:MAG: hypothetical protein P4L73_19835 [Caulobacteraceae bacterium]|nr:hypothetical protein [Caulobacteraceae bacterium]